MELPDSGIKPRSPALQADSLPNELSGKQYRERSFLIGTTSHSLLSHFGLFSLKIMYRNIWAVEQGQKVGNVPSNGWQCYIKDQSREPFRGQRVFFHGLLGGWTHCRLRRWTSWVGLAGQPICGGSRGPLGWPVCGCRCSSEEQAAGSSHLSAESEMRPRRGLVWEAPGWAEILLGYIHKWYSTMIMLDHSRILSSPWHGNHSLLYEQDT